MDNLPVSMPSSPGQGADREWIAGAVATLLGFYWQANDDPRLVAAQGALWCDDLETFPRPVIELALNSWRRNQTRRPSPGDIIALCRKYMPRPTAVAQLEPPERRTSPEERERIQAIVAENFPELRRMSKAGDE
jgi:hypothetical protein